MTIDVSSTARNVSLANFYLPYPFNLFFQLVFSVIAFVKKKKKKKKKKCAQRGLPCGSPECNRSAPCDRRLMQVVVLGARRI